jgi:hypothetical protein
MSPLSRVAVARLIERHVRAQGPVTRAEILGWLAGFEGLTPEQIDAAIAHAIADGRLKAADGTGRTTYRMPHPTQEAA